MEFELNVLDAIGKIDEDTALVEQLAGMKGIGKSNAITADALFSGFPKRGCRHFEFVGAVADENQIVGDCRSLIREPNPAP